MSSKESAATLMPLTWPQAVTLRTVHAALVGLLVWGSYGGHRDSVHDALWGLAFTLALEVLHLHAKFRRYVNAQARKDVDPPE